MFGFNNKNNRFHDRAGLIMTGGGARAAYQVGVLRAIARLVPRGSPIPFQILCGTSAGAINTAGLASGAADFRVAVRRLVSIWRNFHADQVFRTDAPGIARTGAHWLLTMMSAGLLGRHDAQYLLDRQPLRKLLRQHFDAEHIATAIENGILHAVSVTASGYNSGQSISFFQGHPDLEPWERARRIGSRAVIGIPHLMASSAIPFVFAPEKVNREYFGDGSMRQIAPISPALHLGANRVLVIGNRQLDESARPRVRNTHYPTLGEIAGHVLNSIFLDSLEADIERLQRINHTIGSISQRKRDSHGIQLRHVDLLVIAPTEDLGELASCYVQELPWTIRALLRGIGAGRESGASLVSYLLFERSYCRHLIDLGYRDAMAQQDALQSFLFDTGPSEKS